MKRVLNLRDALGGGNGTRLDPKEDQALRQLAEQVAYVIEDWVSVEEPNS